MPVMVRRAKHAGGKKKAKVKMAKASNDGSDAADGDFITPDSIHSTRMDRGSLLGPMPAEEECVLRRAAFKVNHLLEWTNQLLALTHTELCFAVEGEENMRDKIPLHEVPFPPSRPRPRSSSSPTRPLQRLSFICGSTHSDAGIR